MEFITPIIVENADAIAGILLAMGGSFIAKLFVMFTKTKQSKWYKLVEALALVFGKVKDGAK